MPSKATNGGTGVSLGMVLVKLFLRACEAAFWLRLLDVGLRRVFDALGDEANQHDVARRIKVTGSMYTLAK